MEKRSRGDGYNQLQDEFSGDEEAPILPKNRQEELRNQMAQEVVRLGPAVKRLYEEQKELQDKLLDNKEQSKLPQSQVEKNASERLKAALKKQLFAKR